MLGLLLQACLALGIREPMEFFDLSDFAQDMWLANARNEFTGAYGKKSSADKQASRKDRLLEQARARGAVGGRDAR